MNIVKRFLLIVICAALVVIDFALFPFVLLISIILWASTFILTGKDIHHDILMYKHAPLFLISMFIKAYED